MIPIIPDQLSWASTIGLFILNFDSLDLLVQDYLENHLSPAEFEKFKARHFRDRIERIHGLIQQSEFPATKREQFEQWSIRLAPIREIRNHIAHGLLRMTLAQDKKTFEIAISLPRALDGINSLKALHLTFETLLNASQELTDLIEAFKAWDGRWVTDAEIGF